MSSSPSHPVTRTTLDNGLRVVVAEDHAVPVAAIGLWVDAGACDEPEDRRGVAHFLEHMMFRGSEHVGPEEHAQEIARLGGDCNAATGPDFTVYHETVPAGAVEDAVRLEADRFLRLAPSADILGVERRVILEELGAYENQPAVRALLEVQKAIAGDHPYALPPLGRAEDLQALTVEDLER
ncbi:MAG: M16 family metallopeptidase, partial [Planctomycetota bacterium]